MAQYVIMGGRALSGEVKISGAKNAALPIIAAALMTEGVMLYNCPDLSDTRVSMDILKSLGCYCSLIGNTLTIEPYGISSYEITEELCSKMRSSVTFLGALMSVFGRAVIYCPGGCVIGKRPIDIHIDALKQMGADIVEEGGKIICTGSLKGAEITLRYKSVGATENIMLAATRANGITTIKNCAAEPEIVALADFLNRAGAKISGAGTNTIKIEGVKRLGRCEYTIIGDRIEAGTYMCAAAITGGELFINGIEGGMLTSLREVLAESGCVIKESRNLIYIDAPKRLGNIDYVETAPYPAFPTDMQAQLTAVLSVAKGKSVIKENVFEARNKHISQLNKMGADIICTGGDRFDINGVAGLKGAELYAGDLRGGAALVLAALAAEGESRVNNAHYIQRGYENFVNKFTDIGAEIYYKE